MSKCEELYDMSNKK